MLADTESVRYVISSRIGDLDESREFLCTVFVGEVQIVEVNGGLSSEEVKVTAAEAAVRILKARKEEATMDIDMKD